MKTWINMSEQANYESVMRYLKSIDREINMTINNLIVRSKELVLYLFVYSGIRAQGEGGS